MFCHFRNHWYVVEQISNYLHATVRLAEFKGARVCLVHVEVRKMMKTSSLKRGCHWYLLRVVFNEV